MDEKANRDETGTIIRQVGMMEFGATVNVLLLEGFIVLLLIACVIFILSRKKHAKEAQAAHEFIDKLEEKEKTRHKGLKQMINEIRELDDASLDQLIGNITQTENALYQKIIQSFLTRDVELLMNMDEYVNQMSSSYCEAFKSTESDSESNQDDDEIESLKKQLALLSEQLNTSMNTMDDITAEYTRVFSGTQSELELDNSRKKMLQIFADAEKHIKSTGK